MTQEFRAQTVGEEIANSVSHGIGGLAALVGLPLLVIGARPHGTTAVIGAVVFGVTTAVLYLSSTLYHSLAYTRARRFLQIVDHSAIYLLIAGTYTPFTLGILRGRMGWTLFGIVWTLAIGGVVKTFTVGTRYQRLSTALYLGMGWLAVIAAKPLWLLLPGWGLTWLVAGGLFYTVGVMFFASDHQPYHHFVWHLFVLAGTACHFVAVWRYAA